MGTGVTWHKDDAYILSPGSDFGDKLKMLKTKLPKQQLQTYPDGIT